jgi:pentatricopeptide repeat-containing protein PET309
MLYSYLMNLFAHKSEHGNVEQLFKEFLNLLPDEQRERVPISVLSALMKSKLGEKDFAGVQSCWDLALKRVLDDGRGLPPLKAVMSMESDDFPEAVSTEPRLVVPRYQLALMRALMVQLDSLFAQGKIKEMINLINYLVEQDVYIDVVNWNRYIQYLVRSSRFKLAFKLCEKKLINQWAGWTKIRWESKGPNQLSLSLRRKRKDVRFLRPHHTLLLWMAKAFLDLESYAAESAASQKIIDEIEKHCPKTCKAIKTLPRSNDELERRILEGEN